MLNPFKLLQFTGYQRSNERSWVVCRRFVGVIVGMATFLDQSMGIDETNIFQFKFFI